MGAGGTCSFVGSHLDVVPANPETWEVDPFKLTVDGDKLFGRGTTDCLGHVAMIVRSAPTISLLRSQTLTGLWRWGPQTDMFCTIAELKPELDVAVIACFIASEESTAIADVGVDMLVKEGKLEHLKKGPVFWCVTTHRRLCAAHATLTRWFAGRCDSADSQPCIGTAAAIQWTLKATGYLFHSGLPHKGINSLELGSEAVVRAPPAPPPAPAVAATSAERCGGAPGGAPEAFLRGLPRARTGEGLRLCDAVHDEADTDQVRGGGREPAAAVDRVPGEHSRLQTALLAGLRFHTDAPLSSRGTSG